MENNISVSLVDYIGRIDNGVGVILSIVLNDVPYEMVYWFDQESGKRIKIEEKFYDDYPQIINIYDYEYLIDLLYYIDTELLPDKKEIFDNFF